MLKLVFWMGSNMQQISRNLILDRFQIQKSRNILHKMQVWSTGGIFTVWFVTKQKKPQNKLNKLAHFWQRTYRRSIRSGPLRPLPVWYHWCRIKYGFLFRILPKVEHSLAPAALQHHTFFSPPEADTDSLYLSLQTCKCEQEGSAGWLTLLRRDAAVNSVKTTLPASTVSSLSKKKKM